MFFEIKSEAAKLLHSHPIRLTAAAFADRAAGGLPFAGAVVSWYFLTLRAGTGISFLFAFFTFLLLFAISALFRALSLGAIVRSVENPGEDLPDLLYRTYVLIKTQMRIFAKKLGWNVLFALPAAVPVFMLYLCYKQGMLYSAGFLIALVSAASLLIFGRVLYFTATRIYESELYCSAAGGDPAEQRLLSEAGVRRRYAAFVASMTGWRIASVVPLLSLFAVPYVALSKAVCFRRMPGSGEQVRIYNVRRRSSYKRDRSRIPAARRSV